MSGFFTPYFQSFYYELLKQKEKALRLGETAEGEEESQNETNAVHLVASIQKRLHAILLQQAQELQRQTGAMIKATHVHNLHYIFTALADEIFLNIPWQGAETWGQSLLEAHIFNTQMAGENIFNDIEALLEQTDPLAPDMAEIYLFAIGLGFRGRLRHDEETLQRYQMRLRQFVESGTNNSSMEAGKYLMPECYQHTFTEPPGRGLPDIKTWSLWIGSVLLGYWLVSYAVWHVLSKDIRHLTQQITAQSHIDLDDM